MFIRQNGQKPGLITFEPSGKRPQSIGGGSCKWNSQWALHPAGRIHVRHGRRNVVRRMLCCRPASVPRQRWTWTCTSSKGNLFPNQYEHKMSRPAYVPAQVGIARLDGTTTIHRGFARKMQLDRRLLGKTHDGANQFHSTILRGCFHVTQGFCDVRMCRRTGEILLKPSLFHQIFGEFSRPQASK